MALICSRDFNEILFGCEKEGGTPCRRLQKFRSAWKIVISMIGDLLGLPLVG